MPDQLPGIEVVGQRRLPGGTFPTGGSAGTGGGTGDGGGVHQNEVGMEDPPPPTQDPCADPELAREWNADAAAAQAAREFARLAAERSPPEDLNTREWACYLFVAPDGSIQAGPITFGDPFEFGGVGTVRPSDAGIDPATIIGSVHSHATGSHIPSTGPGPGWADRGDIGHVMSTAEWVTANGGRGDLFRMYIVSQNQGPANFDPYNQINVYTPATAQEARDTFTAGPEVNPEAAPCPAN